MSEELSGRIAIVTGGASGIGRATAELFVAEGARVVLADVNVDQGEEVASSLGDAAVFQPTDVADAGQVQALVDRAVTAFGGLHVMFNNAGIPGGKLGSFLDDDLDDFERVMAVNLYGVMIGSQRAARYMKDNGGGSIINTTSIAALKPGGGVMTYRASKAGVILFTRSIAIELGSYGIRANCIAPGLIPTGITNYDMTPVIRQLQPLQRKGMPADVANAALFLASERSAQVTGMVLPVDGGTSVGAPAKPPGEPASPGATARTR